MQSLELSINDEKKEKEEKKFNVHVPESKCIINQKIYLLILIIFIILFSIILIILIFVFKQKLQKKLKILKLKKMIFL